MGMKSVRMSRVNHPMPTEDMQHGDVSGLRGQGYRSGSVLRDKHDPPSAPKKRRPFKEYDLTGVPPAAEETTWLSKSGDHGKASKTPSRRT